MPGRAKFRNRAKKDCRFVGAKPGPVRIAGVFLPFVTPESGLELLCMETKVIIAVIGPDQPGIIATITRLLKEKNCNIENVSQTIVQGQFAGMFVVTKPENNGMEQFQDDLSRALSHLGQHVHVKPIATDTPVFDPRGCEPFIITTTGPDQKGLVAGIAEIIAANGVNVTNLLAVFKGGDTPGDNTMIYEVDVPETVDVQKLDQDLRERAQELGLSLSIQHRRIFEAINRV